MKPEERNEFLYRHRELLPYKRQQLILDHLEKAKALIDQALILDKLYDQMDYKTMSTLIREENMNLEKQARLEKLLDEHNQLLARIAKLAEYIRKTKDPEDELERQLEAMENYEMALRDRITGGIF